MTDIDETDEQGAQIPSSVSPEECLRLVIHYRPTGTDFASLSVPSWNQVLGWLKGMDGLRKATGLTA